MSTRADRWGEAIVRSMRACVRWPGVLAPLKAAWLLAGTQLLRRRFLDGFRPEIRTSTGLRLAGGPRDSMLNRIVLYRGAFEPGLTAVVQSVVRAGDCCVDAGANVGYFTLLLAQQVGPDGQVIAIEAAPGNAARVARNVEANGFAARVRLVHAALDDHHGEATFHLSPANDMHSRLEPPGRGDPDYWLVGRRWRPVQVPVRTIAEILGDDAARVSFVKLDIEGTEQRVVPQLLAACTHERLVVALEAKAPHIRDTLAPFEAAGFHAWDLHNDYWWLVNAQVRPPSPVAFADLYRRRFMVDVLLSRTPLRF